MTPHADESLHDIQATLAVEMVKQLPHLTPDAFMTLVGRHVRQLNDVFQVPVPQADLVEAGVLQNSFPAFLLLQSRDPARASWWVVHTWQDYTGELHRLPAVDDKQSLLAYDEAVHQFLASAERLDEGRRILRRLTAVLGLAGPSDDPNYLKITERHTITGGTGRFSGAQGSFTVERLHKFAANSDDSHDTFGRLEGAIILAAGAK